MRLRSSSLLGLLVLVLPLACGASRCASSVGGTRIEAEPPAQAKAALDHFSAERAATRTMTTDQLESRYAVPFRDTLPYAPLSATGLDTIQAKRGAFTPDESARLARDGFVLLPGERQPTFALAYANAFRLHLPVFISVDSILYAIHKSFDTILMGMEQTALTPSLGVMLTEMRDALKDGGLAKADPLVAADVDDYLAVATSLLEEKGVTPVASGHTDAVAALVTHAMAADGMQTVVLFGKERDVDFSQFKPRGHYTQTPELQRYFRAMMWLARTDLRVIEVQPDGSQVFLRRQLEIALALRDLMGDKARAAWTRIDRTTEAFVGERDEMNVRDLDTLARELGIHTLADLPGHTDGDIAATLARTGLGQQRIESQIMTRAANAKGKLPLHTAFALMNQRYTLDSHVLSDLSYDRVGDGTTMRMMPDPLDVGFAALGNDGAAELLRGELDRYKYAPDLHMARVLSSAPGDDYWQSSLYTTWFSALRALSPTPGAFKPTAEGGLPAVTATRAWNARILDTQLASWAELRHDTVLYAKQSYTGVPLCEFPDAYVDPYPEAFRRIALHARLGSKVVTDVLWGDPESHRVTEYASKYFTSLDEIATKLQEMAVAELAGKPLTAAQMDFVNTMISAQYGGGCGGPPRFSGWYARLFVDPSGLYEFSPTITDVHTQPADVGGATVGRVLHVGTGFVNGLVVTVDSCGGSRAYAGYVSSYYETTTTNFERLDDADWKATLQKTPRPEEPAWLTKVLPR